MSNISTNRRRLTDLISPTTFGQSRPWMCVCESDLLSNKHPDKVIVAVIKFRSPDTRDPSAWDTNTSVIAEYVVAQICKKLNLPTPEFGIVDVTEQFAHSSDVNKDLLTRNIGSNFYTKYIEGSYNFSYLKSHIIRPIELDHVARLDSAILNHDRQRANPNVICTNDNNWFLIDHGLSLHVTYWQFVGTSNYRSAIVQDNFFLQHFSFPMLRATNPQSNLYSQWPQVITNDWLKMLWDTLPLEWLENNPLADDMYNCLTSREFALEELQSIYNQTLQIS